MIYAFDTSAFQPLFRNVYRSVFKTLWSGFDAMVEEGAIVSTREVLREIEDGPVAELKEWANQHKDLFPAPSREETEIVTAIFAIEHFQQNIDNKKYYRGGKVADPFVVARAKVLEGTVVTGEEYRRNAAQIPNMCESFEVPCINLEGFMQEQDWSF